MVQSLSGRVRRVEPGEQITGGVAQSFTINLNGERARNQLICEVQWMNGLYAAKHLHVLPQNKGETHKCS